MIDETHDPALRSWVAAANQPGCQFPIQNLPLGVFQAGDEAPARIGVAIGDGVLDVREWIDGENLNGYLALRASERKDLRRIFSRLLRQGSAPRPLIPRDKCKMLLPAVIGDYTDFYASIDHARNVGRLFRPERPLLPNYEHVPIAYHGRSSSIVVSGTEVVRPSGQLGRAAFGPTNELDYEVELGVFIGPGNRMGQPIPIEHAAEHIAGFCLLNDWSAREIQRWEYQPLGPFAGKNFATSISPWMVTMEALTPFRKAAPAHAVATPAYLQSSAGDRIDITVEVYLETPGLQQPVLLSRGSSGNLYWTFAQMLAHHTANGCPLRAGDLIASGTISGPETSNRGCLLELAANGQEPIRLPNGETRSYLLDGDEVIIRGSCRHEEYTSIGFGECTGRIAPVSLRRK